MIFRPFELHLAPIGSAFREGNQLYFAGIEVACCHEVSRPLELEEVAFWEVLFGSLEKLTHPFGIGGLLDDAQGFSAHIFIPADLLLVIAQQVERGKHVAFHEQELSAFKQRFEVAGAGRHKRRPVLFRAATVSLTQSRFAAVVQDPGVLWFQGGSPVEMHFSRFESLEFEVNFSELVMKGHFIGLGIGAFQETGVRILQVALQQVPLTLEIRQLGFFSIGDGSITTEGRHGLAARKAQA